ncbi:3'-5' exonuclease [Mangrovibacterium sp.]|uniref:3'-5' exonuclease n=1 Tax=Mangrovibacterium sp. TaxID=1961364 RepID=UPI003561685E
MNEFVLFIDTETSGMPTRWNAPTAKVDEWPYILQIAWIVCKNNGELVCSRNFYIKQDDSLSAVKPLAAKRISSDALKEKKVERKEVLNVLAADFELYEPLIVGHFLEFDKKMMEVGFTRAEVRQNFEQLPKFCTMINSRRTKDIWGSHKFMQLNELYESLFNRPMDDKDQARSNVEATMAVFFELVRLGKINDRTISQQAKFSRRKWELPLPVVVILSVLIFAALGVLFWYFFL